MIQIDIVEKVSTETEENGVMKNIEVREKKVSANMLINIFKLQIKKVKRKKITLNCDHKYNNNANGTPEIQTYTYDHWQGYKL